MAGVPHHSLDQHLPKLLAAGRKVAIMDQLEDPAEAKGLVKRGLTRIISAGTLLDEDALHSDGFSYLVAISLPSSDILVPETPIGIAALDTSTGAFLTEEAASTAELALALARLQPVEIVVPEAVIAHFEEQLPELLESAAATGDQPADPQLAR